MTHCITKALRIALLAMVGALAFEITIHIVIPNISIWGSSVLTILFFTSATFAVSVTMLRREENSRSVFVEDINDRKRSELELHRISRALTTLSRCNGVLVHASDEAQLLDQICEILVQVGGYRLAWVGYAENDGEKSVRSMAKSGNDDGYIEKAKITWSETERGRGPIGTAIRTGEVYIFRDVLQNPRFSPWREDAVRRGYASVISLPLREGPQIIGALTIYAPEPDAFDNQEVELLKELAADLSYGIVSLRNATQRKRAEEAVRRSEAELCSFVEKSPFGIFRSSIEEDRFLSVNPALVKMLGYASVEELLSTKLSIDVYVNSQDREKILAPLRRDGGFNDIEVQTKRKDRKIVTVRVSGRMADNPLTSSREFVGIVEDITERKQAEEALRESEEHFRQVVEGAPVGMYIQTDGILRYFNPAALTMFGAESASQIVGRGFLEVIHPDTRGTVSERARLVQEEKQAVPFIEERLLRLDGTVFDGEVTAVPFIFEGRGGALVFVRDITERKQAERSLRESEKRYRMLFDHNLAAVFHSSAGKLLDCNEATCEMLGYRREELSELDLRDLYHDPAARDAGQRLLYECGQLTNHQVDLRRKDGSIVTILANLNLIDGEPGQAPVVVGVMLDITQVRKLQEQLLQSQKMEAVGRLAGGIAHDFNNLLMVIKCYAEMLHDRLPAHGGLRQDTEQVLKAADRAASLTSQLLAYSRKQITSPVVFDLNAVINDTAEMLERLIGEDIDFRVDLARSLWAIEADSNQIVQVLMNLCVNARDAMPQGGTLTIMTGNITVKEGRGDGHPCVAPGEYVKLSVIDNGTGISKEAQEHIFEPFFTSKGLGSGTGLGLAMVYGIVKQSGGQVEVESERGEGACFTIYLPKAKVAVVYEKAARSEVQPRGVETLLVAEDEEALREAMCDYLRSLGYTVLSASSGQQALSVASQQMQIDLLITDVVMPEMSGRELSQMLGSIRPGLKTIHMSGYTDDAVLRHGIQNMDATFLQKPFSLGTLAQKVRETLRRTETVQ